jgi:tetratricopeptide (TPR) repeat protein
MSTLTKAERVAAHLDRGDSLTEAGDIRGAHEAYQAAYELDVTHAASIFRVGRSAFGLRDFDRAEKCFRALLLQRLDASLGITKGDIYFYLGDIAAKERKVEKAIPMLERAIAEDKGHPSAAALLATLRS